MKDARLQLHWAAQAVAGVGRTLLPCQADDSHTNFEWVDGTLVGGHGAGIRIRDLTLVLDGKELPLHGRTLDDAFRFFETLLGATLERPAEGLPDHAVACGGLFSADAASLEELHRLYSEAHTALSELQARTPNASPVRCWPHHFDLATLITLGDDRTIGCGFVPGDAQFPEPYYYVTPWPHPESLPPLTRGFWNRERWTGAVLFEREGGVGEFLAETVALAG